MANFLKGFGGGGDSDLAKMAGQKVGSVVEEGVKHVMGGGNKGSKKDEKKAGGEGGAGGGGGGAGGGGGGAGGGGGGAGGGGGGFSVGDALSFVTGNKEHKKGGGSGPGPAPAPRGEHQDDNAEFSLEAGLDDSK